MKCDAPGAERLHEPVGGCSDLAVPGDIGMSLEEAKALLSALQWEFVAAHAAEMGSPQGCGLAMPRSLAGASPAPVAVSHGPRIELRRYRANAMLDA